jgi:hypothetical protein
VRPDEQPHPKAEEGQAVEMELKRWVGKGPLNVVLPVPFEVVTI